MLRVCGKAFRRKGVLYLVFEYIDQSVGASVVLQILVACRFGDILFDFFGPRTCPNRSEEVRMHPNGSEHVRKLEKTYENFEKNRKNFEKILDPREVY